MSIFSLGFSKPKPKNGKIPKAFENKFQKNKDVGRFRTEMF